MDEKRDYEIQRDERMKLLAVTLWQIDAFGRRQRYGIRNARAVR